MILAFSCNRSACYAALENWTLCIQDAKKAIHINPKYSKAYCRLVNALIITKNFKAARQYLLLGLAECGDSSNFKLVENELLKETSIPLKPTPNDFEVLDELGDGNFSKIYKTKMKSTGKLYAIKVIEKATANKMKRRHGNINNEILMEKRVLSKLDHVHIVTLYSTFQDYGSLYYHMEYLEGREVWKTLHGQDGTAVGCYWSIARFILAETITALEYMHKCGIVHRDLKVENMMLTADGHLKLVDFGTSKDLIDTDLNGPEFVGTPDYMSPQTLKSQSVGPEADLWAFGVVAFQLFAGYTTFQAASPYLCFLRIKRGLVRLPAAYPPQFLNFISLMFEKDPRKRLQNACGVFEGSCKPADAEMTTSNHLVNYDFLRKHLFFKDLFKNLQDQSVTYNGNPKEYTDISKDLCQLAQLPAIRVPTLKEICLRAVGDASLLFAECVAEHGGVRPQHIPWMQNFSLFREGLGAMTDDDRRRVAHYLERRNRLHPPLVFRLFNSSVVNSRCLRASPVTREYIGYNRELQGRWVNDFTFVQITDPLYGFTSQTGNSEAEGEAMKRAVSAINKLRPRFVVISGGLTHSSPHESTYAEQVETIKKVASRISETIPVLFVAGLNDVGSTPTPESLSCYRQNFGADYYGFWYGGTRCIVINSSLLINGEYLPAEAKDQEIWFEEEIEQAKMCSNQVLIFSHHPWTSTQSEECTSAQSFIPETIRRKWLQQLRQHKVFRLFFILNSVKYN